MTGRAAAETSFGRDGELLRELAGLRVGACGSRAARRRGFHDAISRRGGRCGCPIKEFTETSDRMMR